MEYYQGGECDNSGMTGHNTREPELTVYATRGKVPLGEWVQQQRVRRTLLPRPVVVQQKPAHVSRTPNTPVPGYIKPRALSFAQVVTEVHRAQQKLIGNS